MKRFSYEWTGEIFLLHIQLNHDGSSSFDVELERHYVGGKVKTETVHVNAGSESHRFMVSRTHPDEMDFWLEYPEAVILEAFKIDDRAYYPTESFYVG